MPPLPHKSDVRKGAVRLGESVPHAALIFAAATHTMTSDQPWPPNDPAARTVAAPDNPG
jgi:hypothetical protein